MKITPLIDLLCTLREHHGELNVVVEDKTATYNMRSIVGAIASSFIKDEHDFYVLKVDRH